MATMGYVPFIRALPCLFFTMGDFLKFSSSCKTGICFSVQPSSMIKFYFFSLLKNSVCSQRFYLKVGSLASDEFSIDISYFLSFLRSSTYPRTQPLLTSLFGISFTSSLIQNICSSTITSPWCKEAILSSVYAKNFPKRVIFAYLVKSRSIILFFNLNHYS